MDEARLKIKQAVNTIAPIDDVETEHIKDILHWLQSDAPIFRVIKPDNPLKHLVSYFVLYDENRGKMMLIDHKKARAWLPTGGHVEPDEDPGVTVVREAWEELGIDAAFTTTFGQDPIFATVTTTKPPGTHTDVSLWYVIDGDSTRPLTYDPREMNGYKWLSIDEILSMPIESLDPHMHRFVQKIITY